jgi:hypothetical protein
MTRLFRFALGIVAAIIAIVVMRANAPATSTALAIESLPSPAGPGSAEPNLAVGPDGRVYLTWIEQLPDTTNALRFAIHDGKSWSAARTIRAGRDFFVNWADFSAMSVHPSKSGKLAVHWLQRHGAGSYAYDVRIALSNDDGKTWNTPAAPHVDRSSTEKGFVAFWPEGDGFGAVWLDGRKADKARPDAKQEMMLMATSRAGTEPATEVRVDERVCDCCQTTAAVTADGPIVAYRDRTANEIRDIYVTRQVGGKWTPGKAVYDDGWSINACPVNGPFIAASGRRVALAWYTAAKDVPRVKMAFSSDAGATFGEPVQIDEGKPAGRVATVLLPDGSALVSWIERTGGDTASVRVRRVTRDGRANAASTVAASSAARASGFSRMAISGDQVYFAWTVPGRPSTVQVARAKASDFR